MDVDLAKDQKEATEECGEYGCQPVEELGTLKGGGKGQPFQGDSSWCNGCGHKRSECRKFTAHKQAKGKSGKRGKRRKAKAKARGIAQERVEEVGGLRAEEKVAERQAQERVRAGARASNKTSMVTIGGGELLAVERH